VQACTVFFLELKHLERRWAVRPIKSALIILLYHSIFLSIGNGGSSKLSPKEIYEYLFVNSRLLSDAEEGFVYPGRPRHPIGNPDAIGSVVYMNCYLAYIFTRRAGQICQDSLRQMPVSKGQSRAKKRSVR